MIEQNPRPLKTLVFSLGLIAIGGMLVLGGMLWKKATDTTRMNDCAGGHVDLKGHGIVIESHNDDQLLRLTLESKAGHSEILTIDTCTAKVIGTLSLDTDPGMQE